MSDRLTSWLRTVIPTAWASLVAWLVLHQVLPSSLADWANGLGATIAVPVALAAVYAGIRWLEVQSWAPKWLVLALLGSVKTPAYQRPTAAGVTPIVPPPSGPTPAA